MDYQIKAFSTHPKWVIGNVNEYSFQAKVYDRPSRIFGIGKGRVSKLAVQNKATHQFILEYDRGWLKKPETDAEKELLRALLLFCKGLPDYSVWQTTLRRPKRFLVADDDVLEYESL